jgi:DNA-binding response OmpR family regulator
VEHRVLASAVPVEHVIAMRLGAIVIDLATLGAAGLGVLEKLCAELPGLGVVVCTGRSTVAQRVRGLRLAPTTGSRSRAIRRRSSPASRPSCAAGAAPTKAAFAPVTAGEVEIRSDLFQAYVRADSIELTRREFELIQLLADAEGRVLPREEIYQRVWGYAMARGDRSVDVFVRKLRQKLEKASPGWRYIHTHFGVGYRFAAEPVPGAVVTDAALDALVAATPVERV